MLRTDSVLSAAKVRNCRSFSEPNFLRRPPCRPRARAATKPASKQPPFESGDGPYKALFAYSKGLPRDAIKVCDEVLRELLATGRKVATVKDVEAISKQLNLKL
jgi:hypothetical protein